MGYNDQRKGYRLYDSSVEDVFKSRDVKFNEGFEDTIKSSPIPQVVIDNNESSNFFETNECSKETFDIVDVQCLKDQESSKNLSKDSSS